MAVERKTYTYTPFTYDEFKPSTETNTAAEKKRKAESAVNKYGDYQQSQNVIDAFGQKTNAENAYNDHFNKGFTYSRDTDYNAIMDKILGREKFSYDLNGDALYQQYKDKYIQQGKMAMADTMGQAAAMTGGYGNSYAAAVGNQAYQASLGQLNDVIPQLYQLALDKYNMEGQDLYNQYGMLSDDRSTEYGMWSDTGNRLAADRGYYSDNANNAYARDYGEWTDKYGRLVADRDYYGNAYDQAWNRDFGMYDSDRTLAHGEHTTSEGYKYQDIADANAYAQWEADHKLAEEQFKFNKEQANKPSAPDVLTPKEYDDMMLGIETAAKSGKDALDIYLRGLMSEGHLSVDQANNIRQRFFPTEIPNPPPYSPGGKGNKGGGRIGFTVDMMN